MRRLACPCASCFCLERHTLARRRGVLAWVVKRAHRANSSRPARSRARAHTLTSGLRHSPRLRREELRRPRRQHGQVVSQPAVRAAQRGGKVREGGAEARLCGRERAERRRLHRGEVTQQRELRSVPGGAGSRAGEGCCPLGQEPRRGTQKESRSGDKAVTRGQGTRVPHRGPPRHPRRGEGGPREGPEGGREPPALTAALASQGASGALAVRWCGAASPAAAHSAEAASTCSLAAARTWAAAAPRPSPAACSAQCAPWSGLGLGLG